MPKAPSTPRPVLYQFAFSHYNEKARWALDWKGIEATHERLLPGPHARVTSKLSGQTATPTLALGDEVVAGSAAIVERLEALVPEPALFPADPAERKAVDEWIGWFDDEVGPAVRLSLFHRILEVPRFAAPLFTTGQPAWKRVPYGLLLPRMVPMLRERMSIDEENDRRSLVVIEAALDRVAEATAATGYLLGDAFTAADLTGASLLFPLARPDTLPFTFPSDVDGVHAAWCARWADHPGVAWTLRILRDHRQAKR